MMFPFFQSLRTLPDCHDFSNMMESDLATASVLPARDKSLDEKGHLCQHEIAKAKDEELKTHLAVIQPKET